MANISVDTIKLKENGNDIIRLAVELNNTFNSLYDRISKMPNVTGEWVGTASEEFVRKLNIEKKYYNAFCNNINNYGKELINGAELMEQAIKKNSIVIDEMKVSIPSSVQNNNRNTSLMDCYK